MSSRKDKWLEIEEDRDIITIGLTDKELMVALDTTMTKKQKNLKIHRMQMMRKSDAAGGRRRGRAELSRKY